MKERFFLYSLVLISFFIFQGNGCSGRIYRQLIQYDTPTPLLYEVNINDRKIDTFSGIDYNKEVDLYDGERVDIFRITLQKSITKKFSVVNTSFQLFTGRYIVNGIDAEYVPLSDSIKYDGSKSGWGFRISVFGGLNFNHKEFRFGAGLEPSINFDFGEYTNFRFEAEKKGIIDNAGGYMSPNLQFVLYSSTKLTERSKLNLQIGLGLPGFVNPLLALQINEHVIWTGFTESRVAFGYMLDINNFKKIF